MLSAPSKSPANNKFPTKLWLAYAAVAVALALAPFLIGAGLGNSWVRILDFVLLYAMLALGLNIVVGYAGLLDLGYIAFYAVGAYFFAIFASLRLDYFAGRGRTGVLGGGHTGCAHIAIAWRLFSHRHAGLW